MVADKKRGLGNGYSYPSLAVLVSLVKISVCVLFGAAGVVFGDDGDEPLKFIEIQPGDTLQSLADEYYGGSVASFLKDSGLTLDEVRPGEIFPSPGKLRKEALEALKKGDELVATLQHLGAMEISPASYSRLFGAVQRAREQMGRGEHDRARDTVDLVLPDLRGLVEATERDAYRNIPLEVLKSGGKLLVSRDGEDVVLNTGGEVRQGDTIQVGGMARCVLALPNGGWLRLDQGSEAEVVASQSWQDGSRTEVQFSFIKGTLRMFTPPEGALSISHGEWELVPGLSATFNTQLAKGSMVVEVFSGAVAVVQDGKRTSVDAGHQLAFKPGKKPEAFALDVPAPKVRGAVVLVGKDVLEWERGSSHTAVRVEISRDTDFTEIVWDERIDGDSTLLELPLGTYYWRLSGIDKNGFQSEASEPLPLFSKPDLDVRISITPAPFVDPMGLHMVRSDVKIEVATSGRTEIDRIEMRVDGVGSWEPLPEKIDLDLAKERMVLFSFRAKSGGLTGQKQQVQLQVDDQPPQLMLRADLEKGEVDTVEVSAMGVDSQAFGLVPVFVSRGEEAFKLWKNTAQFSLKEAGELRFFAKDNAGNTSPIQSLNLDNLR